MHEIIVSEVPETFSGADANILEDSLGDPEALRLAINQLPHQLRRAMELLKLQEMSLKEASAASGISAGSLKVAVHRAIGALRNALRQ